MQTRRKSYGRTPSRTSNTTTGLDEVLNSVAASGHTTITTTAITTSTSSSMSEDSIAVASNMNDNPNGDFSEDPEIPDLEDIGGMSHGDSVRNTESGVIPRRNKAQTNVTTSHVSPILTTTTESREKELQLLVTDTRVHLQNMHDAHVVREERLARQVVQLQEESQAKEQARLEQTTEMQRLYHALKKSQEEIQLNAQTQLSKLHEENRKKSEEIIHLRQMQEATARSLNDNPAGNQSSHTSSQAQSSNHRTSDERRIADQQNPLCSDCRENHEIATCGSDTDNVNLSQNPIPATFGLSDNATADASCSDRNPQHMPSLESNVNLYETHVLSPAQIDAKLRAYQLLGLRPPNELLLAGSEEITSNWTPISRETVRQSNNVNTQNLRSTPASRSVSGTDAVNEGLNKNHTLTRAPPTYESCQSGEDVMRPDSRNQQRNNHHRMRRITPAGDEYDDEVNSHIPMPRPSLYSGKTSWDSFIIPFEINAKNGGWSESEKVTRLLGSLTGAACDYAVIQVDPDVRNNYEALKRALERRYQEKWSPTDCVRRLQIRTLGTGESVADYVADIQQLVMRGYPGSPESLRSQLEYTHFLNGLTDKEAKIAVGMTSHETIQQACAAYEKYKSLNDEPKVPKGRNPRVRNVEVESNSEILSEGDIAIGAVNSYPPNKRFVTEGALDSKFSKLMDSVNSSLEKFHTKVVSDVATQVKDLVPKSVQEEFSKRRANAMRMKDQNRNNKGANRCYACDAFGHFANDPICPKFTQRGTVPARQGNNSAAQNQGNE